MNSKKKFAMRIVLYTVLIITFILSSFSIYFNFCYTPIMVSGRSMYPTLNNGEFGYAKTTNHAINKIQRDDIIIFHPSSLIDSSEYLDEIYVKRVIALPNETFYFDSKTCDIRINGSIIPQSYISNEVKKETSLNAKNEFCDKEIVLNDDQFIVLGDNRKVSMDSLHGIGFVKKDSIVGVLKVVMASCSDVNENGNVCNINRRHYYNIMEWKYF